MHTTCRFSGEKLLKSGLKLIGGKTKTRDIFYRYRPAQVERYIEPFMGSGNVWIGQPKYAEECISDVNAAAIGFFQWMQRDPDNLWAAIREYDAGIKALGAQGFYAARDNEPRFAGPRHAAWFYAVTKYSMNGIFRRNQDGKCNSSWCKTTEGRGIYTEKWFWSVVDRISGASLAVLDYEDALWLNDSEYAWAFVDPPYRACKTTYNGIAFSDQDHIELRDALAGLRAKWLLTINDDLFTRELYRDFHILPHEINYSCSQTPAGRGNRPELIVTNYMPPGVGIHGRATVVRV